MTNTESSTPVPPRTSEGAEEWLYELGVPRYQAKAFGAYYALVGGGRAYSAVKSEFDYDPAGGALLRLYGRAMV